jgi:hypothetical protein
VAQFPVNCSVTRDEHYDFLTLDGNGVAQISAKVKSPKCTPTPRSREIRCCDGSTRTRFITLPLHWQKSDLEPPMRTAIRFQHWESLFSWLLTFEGSRFRFNFSQFCGVRQHPFRKQFHIIYYFKRLRIRILLAGVRTHIWQSSGSNAEIAPVL